jgi:GxxExxY protein
MANDRDILNRQGAKTPRGRLEEPTEEEDRIGAAIVHAAFLVHKALGPGLLESIYEACLCYELSKAGLEAQRQVPVPLVYDGHHFDEGFRIDVLVERRVICELKSVERVHPVHDARLLSYLRLTSTRLGYMINFNVPLIKEGIKRMVSSW